MAYVALFDFLGFKEYIRGFSEDALVNAQVEYGEEIDRALTDATRIPKEWKELLGPRMPVHHRFCEHARFSDTILLYSRDETELSLRFLSVASANLVANLNAMGRPVRGAITRGPLLADPRTNSFIGESIVRAYELEQQQEWAGAILDTAPGRITGRKLSTGFIRAMIDTGLLCVYHAPVKTGVVRPYLVVGWPLLCTLTPDQLSANLLRTPPDGKGPRGVEWGAISKVRNTVDFYKAYRKGRRKAKPLNAKQALAVKGEVSR